MIDDTQAARLRELIANRSQAEAIMSTYMCTTVRHRDPDLRQSIVDGVTATRHALDAYINVLAQRGPFKITEGEHELLLTHARATRNDRGTLLIVSVEVLRTTSAKWPVGTKGELVFSLDSVAATSQAAEMVHASKCEMLSAVANTAIDAAADSKPVNLDAAINARVEVSCTKGLTRMSRVEFWKTVYRPVAVAP